MQSMRLEMFPESLRSKFPKSDDKGLEEIRIRNGWPVELRYGNESIIGKEKIDTNEMIEILNYLTDYSVYALAEELKEGFFTLKGGHRVGVVGRTERGEILDGKELKVMGIRNISGLNIRIAHQVKGCAEKILPFIRDENGIYNTIIFSQPGVGKTTVLRDCIRSLSYGTDTLHGVKVGVVDERSEIAATYQGTSQNDLGPLTDVLDNCPKSRGMLMLIRSMSPQIIAVDELGAKEDFSALYQAIYSGIFVLGTVHAQTVEELMNKPFFCDLVKQKMIQRYIWLFREKNGKRGFCVYDQTQKIIC